MIAVKCPHCHVGLKVAEGKIPLGITSFKCPKCKEPIPLSLLSEKSNHQEVEYDFSDTCQDWNRQTDGSSRRRYT